jgi:hypothetical protein
VGAGAAAAKAIEKIFVLAVGCSVMDNRLEFIF